MLLDLKIIIGEINKMIVIALTTILILQDYITESGQKLCGYLLFLSMIFDGLMLILFFNTYIVFFALSFSIGIVCLLFAGLKETFEGLKEEGFWK
jgi:hypothetical protein